MTEWPPAKSVPTKRLKQRSALERIAGEVVDGGDVVGIGPVAQAEREDGKRAESDHASSMARRRPERMRERDIRR